MSESSPNKAVPNRKIVILILALPIVMMLGGVLLFTYGRDFVDGGATAEGALLTTPTELTELGLANVPGPGRWRLLLVCEEPAGNDCMAAASHLNSIPILLGKDKPRLQLVAITPSGGALPAVMADWAPVAASLTDLRRSLAKQNIAVNSFTNYALIADPGGRAVLAYQRQQLGSPLLTDLKRLLRLSRIG